ncbi:putative NRPS-like protein biosynthetic cluster [Marasmius tenuissimus]|nr:putative NRPS-like protein biosynthetic cluster [Marasmius tenuissimus]
MVLEKFLKDLPSSVSSSTTRNFKIPPLDGSLTLPEIYDWHFVHNPNKTVFVYESEPVGYTHIAYREIIPASHRAAEWIASRSSINLNGDGMDTIPPVAIIATTDTITHFCAQLGLLKAGISYIAITPRTSAAVVAYLADKVGVEYVFHSSEPAVEALSKEACEHMERHYSRPLKYFAMPEYGDIFHDGWWPALKKRNYGLEFTAIYSHSSGSTGTFPKPIPWTHAFILQLAMAPLFGDVDFCDQVIAYHSASMSHGSGKHLLPFIASSGMVIAVFPPCTPAKFPSPETTYQAFAKVKPDYVWVFPNLLESWSVDPDKVATLKTVKRAIFVGSMLNKDVGDYLAKCGVQIYPLYGMAEAGVLARFMPPPQGLDWEYFPLTAHSNAHFIDRGDNLHELFLVEHQFKRLYLSNTTFQGAKAYATRDAFMEHPSKSGYWKVCGRLDDRIVHPTGEKTDPVPMEHIMDRDTQVKSSIVFGNGRNRCGVLFQLEDPFVFDPNDQRMLATFRQYILPKVEAANEIAPTYSRIYPEMILVTSPQKPFMYTEKGSLKRKEILREYIPEIDVLYNQSEEEIKFEISFPENRELANVISFVQRVLKTIPLDVPEEEDVFRYGCSSLQATRIEIIIRNSLEGVLNSHSAVKSIRNFVYEYQTPRGIAQYLISTFHEAAATSITPRIKEMEQLVDSLVTNFPFFGFERTVGIKDSESESVVVLVTGTTGALGSNLLSTLLGDDTVHKVYALNRRNMDKNLHERQRDAFLKQGLDPELLVGPKVNLLEADLARPHFGLDKSDFEKMRHSVTHIYHLAWDVNWLVRLPSFGNLLQGLRNLIDFALSSTRPRPPAFIYTSSIGVYHNVSTGKEMQEISLPDLAYAEGQGYAESKAVAERILETAGKHTALRPSIIRLGQISGGASGAWTTKEWFPTILKSSIAIGKLPELEGVISFLPVHRAAEVLSDFRDAYAPFLHLVNPQRTSFEEISEFFSGVLSLPLVPYQDWVQAVEESESRCASSPELLAQIPASTILDFFRERRSKSGPEALGYPLLDTSIAQSLSRGLREVTPTGIEEAERWLRYWKRIRFL